MPLAPSRRPALAASIAMGVLVAAGVGVAYLQGTGAYLPGQRGVSADAQMTGSATITSSPDGAEVIVDGVVRGTTPLRLSLPVGQHALEIRTGTVKRSLPLTIETGTLVSQYVELLAEAKASSGRLEITSEPAGAQVRIDGALRGTTPLTMAALEPREYHVAISSGDTVVNRVVIVAPGATASVVASIANSGTSAGYVSFPAPFALRVFEAGRLVGSTDAERLMLPAGRHNLELVNDALEFRTAMTVQVDAGKTTTAQVRVPNGTLSVNALPWAEVWIDGRAVGTTPLGNLSVPIGSHEIVWRHPQHGERRRTITVTAATPVRSGLDFSQ